MMGDTIPNSMHEVIRNSLWRKVTNCLAEISSERELKLKDSFIKKLD